MATSLEAVVSTVQFTSLALPPRAVTKIRPYSQNVSKSFGVEPVANRVSCSFHDHLKNLTLKCVDATKIAGFALATSALVVSGANAEGVPKRLTFDEIKVRLTWK